MREAFRLRPDVTVTERQVAAFELLAGAAGATAHTVTYDDLRRLAKDIHVTHQDGFARLTSLAFGHSNRDVARLLAIGELALQLRGEGAVVSAAELETVRRLFDTLQHEYGGTGPLQLNQLAAKVLDLAPADVTDEHRRSLLDLIVAAKAAGASPVRTADMRRARQGA